MTEERKNKYADVINLIKNITGAGLAIIIVVANVFLDKDINMMILAIPAILLGIDVKQFFNK